MENSIKIIGKEDSLSKSLNVENQNIDKLINIFPEVIRDGQVDINILKSIIGLKDEMSERRFDFTWYGKENAKSLAQALTTGTLRPLECQSINWNSAENIHIDGDIATEEDIYSKKRDATDKKSR